MNCFKILKNKIISQSHKHNARFPIFHSYFTFISQEGIKLKTIDLIKILRSETNSPLNHIKKALEETNNDINEAKIWLKKKGFKDAENKMNRSANTKLYAMKSQENQIYVAELSCETDFAAGTEMFQNYLNILLSVLVEKNLDQISVDDLDNIKVVDNNFDKRFDNLSLMEGLKLLISKTGENCKIEICRRFGFSDLKSYTVGTYLHSNPSNNMLLGLKASFVILEHPNENLSESQGIRLKSLADKLAMQVVACKPKYLKKSEIPKEMIELEEKICKEGLYNENKLNDNESINKMVRSKMNNWYEESVFQEQKFVIVDHESSDTNITVENLVSRTGKELGLNNLNIIEFKLFS